MDRITILHSSRVLVDTSAVDSLKSLYWLQLGYVGSFTPLDLLLDEMRIVVSLLTQ